MNTLFTVLAISYFYIVIEVVCQNNGNSIVVLKSNEKSAKDSNILEEEEEYLYPDIYIERPCPVYDRFCIRGFFAQHSKCKIVPGPVPDPFYLAQSQAYATRVNLSIVTIDNYITGLSSGRIDEFYINRVTNKLVLSVYFPNVIARIGQAYFNFFRNGATPVLRSAPVNQTYDGLLATIVFPSINDLQLQDSEITAYLENGLSPFVVGPAVANDSDPVVRAGFAAILQDIPFALRELLPTVIHQFASIWLQYNICDFGASVNKIGY